MDIGATEIIFYGIKGDFELTIVNEPLILKFVVYIKEWFRYKLVIEILAY